MKDGSHILSHILSKNALDRWKFADSIFNPNSSAKTGVQVALEAAEGRCVLSDSFGKEPLAIRTVCRIWIFSQQHEFVCYLQIESVYPETTTFHLPGQHDFDELLNQWLVLIIRICGLDKNQFQGLYI